MLGLRLVKPLVEGKSRKMSRTKSEQGRRDAKPAQAAPTSRSVTGFPIWQLALTLIGLVCAVLYRIGTTPAQSVCISHDQPNQVAEQHPNSATGTLNATLMVIPISMERARQLIPSKYAILEDALRTAFPKLAAGMYPVVLQAAHDHDIQFRAYNMSIPDFSRAGFEFPFIDLLGDGRSTFRWAPAQLISATNEMAIGGSQQYGTVVSPATFEPECNAYTQSSEGGTTFAARSTDSTSYIEMAVSPLQAENDHELSKAALPFPLDFLEEILNQPAFANGSTCDRMQRPFDTSLSQGVFAPTYVEGSVRAKLGPFADAETWQGLQGVQVATPFVEENYLDCRTLAFAR